MQYLEFLIVSTLPCSHVPTSKLAFETARA
jgi:hypothetical protein